jgi:hypothetical protein
MCNVVVLFPSSVLSLLPRYDPSRCLSPRALSSFFISRSFSTCLVPFRSHQFTIPLLPQDFFLLTSVHALIQMPFQPSLLQVKRTIVLQTI